MTVRDRSFFNAAGDNIYDSDDEGLVEDAGMGAPLMFIGTTTAASYPVTRTRVT